MLRISIGYGIPHVIVNFVFTQAPTFLALLALALIINELSGLTLHPLGARHALAVDAGLPEGTPGRLALTGGYWQRER